jgi:hypothetical protein
MHGFLMNRTLGIARQYVQTACALLSCAGSVALAEPAKSAAESAGFLWKSQVPEDCPVEPSKTLTGVFITGRHSDYRCGDTFYPSWASDGNLYSPWTDGKTDGVVSQSGKGANAQTGHAVMIGDDPLKLELIEWNNHMGCVTATYVPGLKKYLMCVTDGWPTVAKMTSYILEADTITGPWRMVAYLKDFGEQAYFLNFPSKFISPDGRTLWLCYSANFSPGWNGVELKLNPPGGRYGLCLHEIKLLGPDSNP